MRRRKRRRSSNSASNGEGARTDVAYRQSQPDEGVSFGCVMLTRVRQQGSGPNGRIPMRCSLGFALRTEEDVCRCMSVSGPGECWKGESGQNVSPLQVEGAS